MQLGFRLFNEILAKERECVGWGRLNVLALLNSMPTTQIYIEKMQFLIPMLDLPFLVDPKQRILNLSLSFAQVFRSWRGPGLVHAYTDGKAQSTSLFAETGKEWRCLSGLAE